MHGLMEGAVHPAFYAMAGKWLPAQEKASLVSLAMFGEFQEIGRGRSKTLLTSFWSNRNDRSAYLLIFHVGSVSGASFFIPLLPWLPASEAVGLV